MKVIVREKAEDDIDDIFQWIARDNPRAAARPRGLFPSPLVGEGARVEAKPNERG